jgi:hypothetical protein
VEPEERNCPHPDVTLGRFFHISVAEPEPVKTQHFAEGVAAIFVAAPPLGKKSFSIKKKLDVKFKITNILYKYTGTGI